MTSSSVSCSWLSSHSLCTDTFRVRGTLKRHPRRKKRRAGDLKTDPSRYRPDRASWRSLSAKTAITFMAMESCACTAFWNCA